MKKVVAVAIQKGNAMTMLARYNAAVMPTRCAKVIVSEQLPELLKCASVCQCQR